MLGKADATPMIAVKDLDRARNFYEQTLGLRAIDDFGEGFVVRRHSLSLMPEPDVKEEVFVTV